MLRHSVTVHRDGKVSMLFLWGCSLLLSLYVGSFIVLLVDDLYVHSGLSQSVPDIFLDNIRTIYWPLIVIVENLGVI